MLPGITGWTAAARQLNGTIDQLSASLLDFTNTLSIAEARANNLSTQASDILGSVLTRGQLYTVKPVIKTIAYGHLSYKTTSSQSHDRISNAKQPV